MAERYSQHLGADLAFVHKRHIKGKADEVEARGVIGDVDGRRCVIIDDRIDTGGTIVAAADILKEHGATEVWAMATHGVLAGSRHRPAQELRDRSGRRHRHACRSPPEKQIDKLEVLSVAEHHRRRHRRGLRGQVGQRDLRRREPDLTVS